jgi:hypothetical protein
LENEPTSFLTALFSSLVKEQNVSSICMLSIREKPAAASRESLSILLQTPIFKCSKTTYYEPKLGKPGFSPRALKK